MLFDISNDVFIRSTRFHIHRYLIFEVYILVTVLNFWNDRRQEEKKITLSFIWDAWKINTVEMTKWKRSNIQRNDDEMAKKVNSKDIFFIKKNNIEWIFQ